MGNVTYEHYDIIYNVAIPVLYKSYLNLAAHEVRKIIDISCRWWSAKYRIRGHTNEMVLMEITSRCETLCFRSSQFWMAGVANKYSVTLYPCCLYQIPSNDCLGRDVYDKTDVNVYFLKPIANFEAINDRLKWRNDVPSIYRYSNLENLFKIYSFQDKPVIDHALNDWCDGFRYDKTYNLYCRYQMNEYSNELFTREYVTTLVEEPIQSINGEYIIIPGESSTLYSIRFSMEEFYTNVPSFEGDIRSVILFVCVKFKTYSTDLRSVMHDHEEVCSGYFDLDNNDFVIQSIFSSNIIRFSKNFKNCSNQRVNDYEWSTFNAYIYYLKNV